jgi:hypothetical protein
MEEFDRKVLKFSHFSVDLARAAFARENEVSLRPKTFESSSISPAMPGSLYAGGIGRWFGRASRIVRHSQCIHELRQKLGDDEHHLIKTVSRRGYLLPTLTSDAPQGETLGRKATAAEFILSSAARPPVNRRSLHQPDRRARAGIFPGRNC